MRELGAPEWTEDDYRLASEFLHTYPRTTMVGIREKLGAYFEPEEDVYKRQRLSGSG